MPRILFVVLLAGCMLQPPKVPQDSKAPTAREYHHHAKKRGLGKKPPLKTAEDGALALYALKHRDIPFVTDPHFCIGGEGTEGDEEDQDFGPDSDIGSCKPALQPA